jgi:hypothetical protein
MTHTTKARRGPGIAPFADIQIVMRESLAILNAAFRARHAAHPDWRQKDLLKAASVPPGTWDSMRAQGYGRAHTIDDLRRGTRDVLEAFGLPLIESQTKPDE